MTLVSRMISNLFFITLGFINNLIIYFAYNDTWYNLFTNTIMFQYIYLRHFTL